MKQTIKYIVLVVAFGAAVANADPMLDTESCDLASLDGPCAIGVSGLEIDGTPYDVSFVSGPFAELFPTEESRESLLFWDDPTGALSAASAIAALFNNGNIQGVVDSSSTIWLGYDVLYGVADGEFQTALTTAPLDASQIPVQVGEWSSSLSSFPISFPDGGLGGSNFALFSLSSTSVPEPGTLALLGAGLVGMGFARRRKKAQ